MNNDNEEWQGMKANWQSASITESFMTEKLRWSLRLRMLGSWVWLCLEVAGAAVVAAIAVIEWARGHAAIAAALFALDAVAIAATVWARRSPLRAATGNLLDLIDLTIARARRSVRFAWAQYFSVAACIAYVAALNFSSLGEPFAAYRDAERTTLAIVIFLLYAAGVGIYHAYARKRGRRFTELRRAFGAESGAEALSADTVSAKSGRDASRR